MIRFPTPWSRPGRSTPDAALLAEGMRHVHLIDTSIASDNIGDEIIVDAAIRQLGPKLANAYVTRSAGHEGLGPAGRRLVETAELVLLLGTNAISAKYKVGRRFIWRVKSADVPLLEGKLVLFGVGANAPFEQIESAQLKFLSRVLSAEHRHSVRDGRAHAIVEAAGRSALNTSCPTLWDCADAPLPTRKADTVCFTLTEHKPHPFDRQMIDTLAAHYRRLVFFPQQARDLRYLRQISDRPGIEILAPNLAAYDRFLADTDTDVVGTRLHGTIRAVQHGRRSLVIRIDNRAEDIGRETGLPTLARTDMHALPQWLDGGASTSLVLPRREIAAFMQQL